MAKALAKAAFPKRTINAGEACAVLAAAKEPNRVVVEFCCSDKSKLCTPSKNSIGCHFVRVTEKEDPTVKKNLDWFVAEILRPFLARAVPLGHT